MKRIICSFMLFSILIFSETNTYASSNRLIPKTDISLSEKTVLDNLQTAKIISDIDILNILHIDVSCIEKVTLTENGTKYYMNYDGLKEFLLLKKNDIGDIILDITSEKKHNILTITVNGDLCLIIIK